MVNVAAAVVGTLKREAEGVEEGEAAGEAEGAGVREAQGEAEGEGSALALPPPPSSSPEEGVS